MASGFVLAITTTHGVAEHGMVYDFCHAIVVGTGGLLAPLMMQKSVALYKFISKKIRRREPKKI